MRGGRGGFPGGNPNLNPALNPLAPMFSGQPNPAMAAPGMLFPPPGMPGFPGMEQLFLGGAGPIPGFHPGNNYGSGQPFFHPLAGCPPGQFGNQFRFPGVMGRGMGRGFAVNGRGLDRGRGGRGRGGRGGYQRTNEHHKPSVLNHEEEKHETNTNNEEVDGVKEENAGQIIDPGGGTNPNVDTDQGLAQNGDPGAADGLTPTDEPPKNVISGQVS